MDGPACGAKPFHERAQTKGADGTDPPFVRNNDNSFRAMSPCSFEEEGRGGVANDNRSDLDLGRCYGMYCTAPERYSYAYICIHRPKYRMHMVSFVSRRSARVFSFRSLVPRFFRSHYLYRYRYLNNRTCCLSPLADHPIHPWENGCF